ncbi:cupin domain-containing protein [Aquimarina aggregata]|uniref:cupin domain-containing protein n=1 Tax=Aquimarina aggregata TaxID=1642818 RepID=UPI002491F0D7|nr:cupin domain-containing protein [Aquimarina aggregata]
MLVKENIPKQQEKFDSDWWKNTFLKNTDTLNKTSVFRDCISRQETAAMRLEIMDILRTLCELRTDQFGFRVFVEGKQLYNKEMDLVYDSPPKKKETINDWTKRTFKNKKFGMIINRGEKINKLLAQRIAHKISPLLPQVGIPLMGINFTIFIGNYGWTPLGIHTDAPGESVTHFHLGPGDKTMYTWDKKTYEKKAGDHKFNNKDVEQYLPLANVHPFKEGDLYYMPPNEYHIGKSDELSMGLTMWFNNHMKRDLAKKILQVIVDQYLDECTETMLPDKREIDDLSAAQQAIELFKIPQDLAQLTFKDFIQETFKDYRYSMYSNSGFWTRPFPKEKEIEYTKKDSIILEKPFEIKYSDSLDKENLLIYVRGTKLVLHNHDKIKKLINEINKGEEMTVAKALSILDKDWDESIGIYILTLLDTHNGIKKI